MIFTTANFPISGPIENPTRDDYAIEAGLLSDAAKLSWQDDPALASHYSYLGRRFRLVARKLSWSSPPQSKAEIAA